MKRKLSNDCSSGEMIDWMNVLETMSKEYNVSLQAHYAQKEIDDTDTDKQRVSNEDQRGGSHLPPII